MTLRRLCTISAALAALAASAGPAFAHHSATQYDRARPIVLKGSVRGLQWSNPHSWLEIDAAAPTGKAPVKWMIELEGPTVMVREGWTVHSVAAGDLVTMRVMPSKDGHHEARLIDLKLANGTVLHLFTPRPTS